MMQEREDIEARPVSEVKVSAELATLNPIRWLAACAADWTMIVIAMVVAHQIGRAWAYLLAIAVIGARQHALLLLAHDATHYLVSRKKWLNDLLSNALVAYPFLWTTEGYRWWHFLHHRYVGTLEDVELQLKAKTAAHLWSLPLKVRVLIVDGLATLVVGWLSLPFVAFFVFPPRQKWRLIPMLAFQVIALVIAGVTGTLWAIGLWYVSASTSMLIVFKIRQWTEHVGTDDTQRITASRLWRFWILPHNTWMHWEHHRWPFIPFHNLSRARRLETSVPVIALTQLWRQSRGSVPNARATEARSAPGSIGAA